MLRFALRVTLCDAGLGSRITWRSRLAASHGCAGVTDPEVDVLVAGVGAAEPHTVMCKYIHVCDI